MTRHHDFRYVGTARGLREYLQVLIAICLQQGIEI
jgi:hypothetical protein